MSIAATPSSSAALIAENEPAHTTTTPTSARWARVIVPNNGRRGPTVSCQCGETHDPSSCARPRADSARARKAVHGVEQLLALLLRCSGVARRERACDAVVYVVVEDDEGEAVERGRDRRDLGEDVDAVAILLDHPLDPAYLSLDAVETPDERVLVRRVSVRRRLVLLAHAGAPSRAEWKRRRRSEFVTTKTLENAIAAAATIGSRRPATASGIAATLYANAQKRLPRIVRSVRRARATPSAAARRSPETSVMSEASIATSVPVPIAIPRSACARAGASLTPSPTIATTWPCSCRRRTSATLSAGCTSATTSSIPTSEATRLAASRLSPVSRIGVKPRPRSSATASLLVGLTVSRTVSVARGRPSHETAIVPS